MRFHEEDQIRTGRDCVVTKQPNAMLKDVPDNWPETTELRAHSRVDGLTLRATLSGPGATFHQQPVLVFPFVKLPHNWHQWVTGWRSW
jgi:hypothetical protein